MTEPTIISLCSGYEGLGMGVMAVLGGHLMAVADNDPGAEAILAHRFPHVPNLGDISDISWDADNAPDILCAGFPCQDVSCAGARVGLRQGTRSGVWAHVANAIGVLEPRLVVIENVRGLLSFGADSNVESCPWCLGEDDLEHALRASGAVLGDLADIGFDAEWVLVSAKDAGGCHGRPRVFIVAWAAPDTEADIRGGRSRELSSPRSDGANGQSSGPVGPVGDAPVGSHLLAADPGGQRRLGWPDRRGTRGTATLRQQAGHHGRYGGDASAEDADRPVGGERWLSGSGQAPGGWAWPDAGGRSGAPVAPDTQRGTGDGWPDEPLRGPHRGTTAARDSQADDIAWGDYEPAIRRWERASGRPAPRPTEPGRTGERLSPRFVEWMMGLPDGWVTTVPGLSRNAQLKALGNGCVPQQVALALSLLLPYVPAEALAFLERAA